MERDGYAPHVRVWRINGGAATETAGFYAFDPAFTGGVFLTAADLGGDGRAEILVAPQAGGGPELRVFSGTGEPESSVMVFDPDYRGGVRLLAGDLNGDGEPDVMLMPESGERATVRLMSGSGFVDPTDFDLAFAFPGVFVG